MILAARAMLRILLSVWGLSEAMFLLNVFRYHLEARAMRRGQWCW